MYNALTPQQKWFPDAIQGAKEWNRSQEIYFSELTKHIVEVQEAYEDWYNLILAN